MAKFFGKIGYVMSRNTAPGVWEEDDVIEKGISWRYFEKIDPLSNVRQSE